MSFDVDTAASSRCGPACRSTAEVDTLSLIDKFIYILQTLFQLNLLVQCRLHSLVGWGRCHGSHACCWRASWCLGYQSIQEFLCIQRPMAWLEVSCPFR